MRHSDDVGLQFLLAGEGRQAQLAAGNGLLAGNLVGQNLGGDTAGDHLGLLGALALQAVIGSHVGHFVGNHGGHLG